jgi:hypothetical protein
MSALHTIDTVLGWAEVILVPFSLVWLFVAWRQPRQNLRAAGILALVLALTIAQPFGIVAEQSGPPPATAEQRDPTAIHTADVFGIPLMPFALYSRDNLINLFDGHPTQTLRARSWLWGPLLTNSTKIAAICNESGGPDPPCWNPGRRYGNDLTLSQDGDTYWATLDNSPEPGIPPPIFSQTEYTWKLSFGLASPAGLIYWVLAASLFVLAWRRQAQLPAQPETSGSGDSA